MSASIRRWLREPLTLFLLAGAGLFALDGAVNAGPTTTLTVPQARVEMAREQLTRRLGRAPDAAELRAALDGWIEEELLYRAALELELGRGDPIIRRRLAQKMRLLLEQRASARAPDESELRTLLAEQPERYATPARYSFEHRFFSREEHGDAAASAAAAALDALAADPGAQPAGAAPFFAGASFDALPAGQIRKLFGADFAAAIETLPENGWQGPLRSGYGAHLVRVSRIRPAEPARFEVVQDSLRRDWQERHRQQLLREALAELRARHHIVLATP